MNHPSSFLKFLSIFFLINIYACGSSSSGTTDDTEDETGSETEETDDTDDTVNTTKLVGTPFDGLERGDDIDWDFFICGDYRSETIDELPIKIFAAFFTASEEETIQEGIDIANEAMGPTDEGGVFYELTDTWADNVRVIYFVTNSINEETGIDYEFAGHTQGFDSSFNDKFYADTFMPDWSIELLEEGINEWIVAHEIGHASGIGGHWLINYDEDSFTSAGDGEVMDPGHSRTDPLTDEYNFMMSEQGQIIQTFLTQLGNLRGEDCD